MAITSVNKVRIVETADTTYDGSSYEVLYLVKTDDIDTALTDILNAAGIPAFGAEFDEISGAYCTGKSADLVGSSRTVWQVAVTYDNSKTQGEVDGTATTVYTWGSETSTQTFTVDLEGNTVSNVVGDPFIPAPETTIHLLTLRVEREEETFGGTTVETYVNSLNNSAVTIDGYTIAAKTGLMKKVAGTYDPTTEKYKVTYEITVKKPDLTWTVTIPDPVPTADNAWLLRVLNTGLRELDVANNKIIPIIDPESKKEITTPVALHSNGKALTVAQLQAGAAYWLGFKEFSPVEWAPLSL